MKLALHGGPPVRTRPWPAWPPACPEAHPFLEAVLARHRWSIRGEFTGTPSLHTDFCAQFTRHLGAAGSLLTTTGSAALQLCLEALDIGAEDEVIVPIYTWIATPIAVLNVNATPVFVDVEEATGCIDPVAVERAITPRTRALLCVHLHTSVANLGALRTLADRHGIALIEDCAQAAGAAWDRSSVGTVGTISAFSFNQEKLLCCGEGGAVVSRSTDLLERVERLRSDGARRRRDAAVIGEYEMEDLPGLMGINACPSDFQAAVLLAELPKLAGRSEMREGNAVVLDRALSRIGLRVVETADRTTRRAYCKYVIRRREGDFSGAPTSAICEALTAELGLRFSQTECRPMHLEPLYCPASKRRHRLSQAYLQGLSLEGARFPRAESHYSETIACHHRLLLSEEDDLADVVNAFEKIHLASETLRPPQASSP
jgi:dTDP-4-amino-4,6-dideoxygalactose transaminase